MIRSDKSETIRILSKDRDRLLSNQNQNYVVPY